MTWEGAAGLAIFVVGLAAPLLLNFSLLVAAPTSAVFFATLFGLPPLNWLLVTAMFAGVDAPGGMTVLFVVPEAAAGWLFGVLARGSISHGYGRVSPAASLLLYVAAAALLFFYPGFPAIGMIAAKASDVSFILLVASLILGYFPMQLLSSRSSAVLIATGAALLTALAWVTLLNARLRLDQLYLVGLTLVLSELSYGIVTGALARAVLPQLTDTKQRWIRTAIAFVPLALIGIALSEMLAGNL